ncbi:MAG: hypothetical protein SFU56_11315 [Capsulimonadales bacterium]|nr:hypothetical protein [Capsulimonadales bacterium]
MYQNFVWRNLRKQWKASFSALESELSEYGLEAYDMDREFPKRFRLSPLLDELADEEELCGVYPFASQNYLRFSFTPEGMHPGKMSHTWVEADNDGNFHVYQYRRTTDRTVDLIPVVEGDAPHVAETVVRLLREEQRER